MSTDYPDHFELDARRALGYLTRTLDSDSEQLLRSVAAGDEAQCDGSLASFALQQHFGILPASLYGTPGAKHFFVHSMSVATELRRFAEYGQMMPDRFARRETPFQFVDGAPQYASFHALQQALGGPGALLTHDGVVDSLYLLIYAGGHCSLMIVSGRRRKAVHLDSLCIPEHQELARRLMALMISARLLPPNLIELVFPRTSLQRGSWECNWCALMFAGWWKEQQGDGDVHAALAVPVTQPAIVALAREMLACNERMKKLLCYSKRLKRSYGVFQGRVPEKRTAQTQMNLLVTL